MPPLRSKDSELILGYRLIERLGAGGFGEVWKAEAPGGLLKAVKFVYGEMSGRQASQEIKALDRIKEVRHPFVLSLERAEIVGGQLIVVSELADGTLLDRFEACRAEGEAGIPREELLLYLRDAAEALDFISSQFHLQHLDIKPSNLFLMGAHLKVGDFGLVREICQNTGMSVGGLSPIYAAPEMFSGRFSLYSDQYGLAIVYQEMLTGTRPFRGRTAAQLSEQHLHAYPTLTALSVADQAIIGRALSKNPKDRFPTCEELIRALAGNEPNVASYPYRESRPEPAPEQSRQFTPEVGCAIPLPEHDPRSVDHPGCPTGTTAASLGSATSADADFHGDAPEFYQEETREPTLFVGIGGLASGVLAQLKHLFESRSGRHDVKRPLGWLLLDTDRVAIQRVRGPDLPGSLEDDETVLMPLHGADHYQPHCKQLLGWLGRHWLYRIPRSKCVEGIRALGRLALIDNGNEVMARLRQAVRQVRSLISDEAERARLQTVVIASISGGTGGGCLVDVGFALRRILGEEGLEEVKVTSVLILASSARKEKKELAHANTYVTLSELHSFLESDCRFPGVKALGLTPLEGQSVLFDDVVLADFGDLVVETDSSAGTHLLAEYVYLQRGTPCARLSSPEQDLLGNASRLTRIRRFRLARVGFLRSDLVRVISREVCLRMIRRWLQGPPTQSGIASSLPFCLSTRHPALPRKGNGGDAETTPGTLALDEESFYEVVLERVQRASGSDPLEFFQQKTREVLQHHGKEELNQALGRYYDEIDERFGPGPPRSPEPSSASPLQRKLRDEFKHDRVELEKRLESWVRGIVDEPGSRLTTAGDGLLRLSRELTAQIDAASARIQKIQVQRTEIRDRRPFPAGSARASLPNPLRTMHRESTPQADELCRYGQLWIQETAHSIRAEILSALLAKVRQLEEGLARLRRSIEGAGRIFVVNDRGIRTSDSAPLGRSVELFPGNAVGLDELRTTLTDSYCSDRRLGGIERRLQEEVLEAHGGLVAMMGRETRFVTQLFEHDLFQRVAQGVGRWLEDWDAASLLLHRRGSDEGVIAELVEFWKSIAPDAAASPSMRVILGIPPSPSGRSLRELMASKPSTRFITDFVAIPDDIVLCVESEDLSFASVAAAMVGEHPWITDLAHKLVSRKDIAWASLFGTD